MDELEDDVMEVPPQVAFGITILEMTDGSPKVQVTGEPDLGQLQRLLSMGLMNIEADIIASKVVQKMQDAKKKQRIVTP
jgi:hypothetical protein